MSSDAMSEQSSVREGVGYDKAFGSGVESEDFSPSSRREASAQSLDGEDECYVEDLEIEVGKENWIDGGNAPDGRRMTVTKVMTRKGLVRGTQQVLEITVPLFFPRSGLSTSFYRQ